MGGLQVDYDSPLFLEVIRDLAGILKAFGLDEHNLQLGGSVDIYHLAPPAVHDVPICAPGPFVQERGILVVKDLIVIVVLVADWTDHSLNIVQQVHVETSHRYW